VTESEALATAIDATRRLAQQPELVAARRAALKQLVDFGWTLQRIADAIDTTKSNVAYILRSKP